MKPMFDISVMFASNLTSATIQEHNRDSPTTTNTTNNRPATIISQQTLPFPFNARLRPLHLSPVRSLSSPPLATAACDPPPPPPTVHHHQPSSQQLHQPSASAQHLHLQQHANAIGHTTASHHHHHAPHQSHHQSHNLLEGIRKRQLT